MTKEERKKHEKKLKIYKMLGAEKFQKVVFKVEEIKFKLIKKVCPNFIKLFDRYCDYRQKKALRKAKTEKERQDIIRSVKFSKMAMRKEMNTEKNRNYHMSKSKPTEIIDYLKWNKRVHKKGLIKDLVVIPILVGAIAYGFAPAIPLLVIELLSVGINFECINIQNYNLCRMKPIEERLKKIEERTIEENIDQYGQAAEVIHKSIEQSEQLPTFDEIIANIDSPEQLRQMKELLLKKQQERKQEEKAKVKKGGK